jgi:hypothetical protein
MESDKQDIVEKNIYIRLITDSIRCIFITTLTEWNTYMELIKKWNPDIVLYLEGQFTISVKALLERYRILTDSEEIAAYHTLIGNRAWIGFNFMESLRLSIDLRKDVDGPSRGVLPKEGVPIVLNY